MEKKFLITSIFRSFLAKDSDVIQYLYGCFLLVCWFGFSESLELRIKWNQDIIGCATIYAF